MTSSKEGMSDCATAGEEPPSGMCTAFVPHVTLTCAVCGQPATAHVGAAHAGLVAALEDVLRTAGTALETLRAAAAEDAETADAAAVDAADGLVRGATARLEAALDAVIAPERARARAGVARRQRAARRARVLAELVATEDEYAHDLATLLDVWRPAVAAAGVLDARQTALVFGDVPRLLYLARTLAEQLHAVAARPPAAQDLGAVLLRTVPFMRVYVDQCGSVPRVTELLHTVATRPQYIQAQSRVLKNPRAKNLDLAGFIIKPTQRLALYPLLVGDILKATEPDHTDYANLSKALLSLKAILNEVNESTRMRESQEFFHAFSQHVLWESTPIDLAASKCFVLHSGRVNWTYSRVARAGQPDDADTASTQQQQQGNFALLLNNLVVLADFSPATGLYHEKKALPVGGMRLPGEGAADALDITVELFSTKKLFVSDSPGSLPPPPSQSTAATTPEPALPPSVTAPATPSAAGTPRLLSPTRSDGETDLLPRSRAFRTKYVLVLRCADFLDMQSWRTHLRTAVGASTETVPTFTKARVRRDAAQPGTLRSRAFLLFPTLGASAAAGAPHASSSPTRHQRTATAGGGSCPPETRTLSATPRPRRYRLSVEISRSALQSTSALTTPTTVASPKPHRRLHSESNPDMSLP